MMDNLEYLIILQTYIALEEYETNDTHKEVLEELSERW